MLRNYHLNKGKFYLFFLMGSIIGISLLYVFLGIFTSFLFPKYQQVALQEAETNKLNSSLYVDTLIVEEMVVLGDYFQWIDQLLNNYDTVLADTLTERQLIHANPWLIDRFKETDYYYQAEKGNFVFDQREMTILFPSDQILIPNDSLRQVISCMLNSIVLDINIPEFSLRILENDSIHHEIPIRVGKKGRKYLPYLDKEIQMETVTGSGVLVHINKTPEFLKFSSGEKITHTRRDDGQLTLMPQVPAFEPSIAGRRLGQLIHATTNPNTLGKAVSHGCIGTSEANAWVIYFYSMVGTPIEIRYDLQGFDELGNPIQLEDIYFFSEAS